MSIGKYTMISVLIVDDNHSFVDSLKVILKEVPAVQNVQSVSNYQKAENEIVSKQEYHLYILENDAEVNRKGIDFVRSLLKKNSNLKAHNFILLSTKPYELQERAKAEGIRVVRKPLDIPDFKEYINRLIEQKQIGNIETANNKA